MPPICQLEGKEFLLLNKPGLVIRQSREIICASPIDIAHLSNTLHALLHKQFELNALQSLILGHTTTALSYHEMYSMLCQ